MTGEPVFEEPVSDWMVEPVRCIRDDDRIESARAWMEQLRVSALPVLNGTGRLSGVLSWTDLLRVGRMRRLGTSRRHALELPAARVREHMSQLVEIVAPHDSLRQAARQMVRRKVHRVYATKDRIPAGVVSTVEMARAVAMSAYDVPVSELASEHIVSIRSDDPVSLAVDRLVASHRSVLLVLDGAWSVGIFGQEEALAARNAPAGSPVDLWASASFLCVSTDTPVRRVAERLHAMRPRCAVVTESMEVRGIVTGMDFTRIVAKS